jgi:hypothetical protein
MTITFDWDNPQETVIRLRADGDWNWNDLHKNMRRAAFWLDASDGPVDLVLDLRGGSRLPAGALGHIRSLGKPIHPNGRPRLIIVGLDESVAGPLGGDDGIYRQGEREIHFVSDDAAVAAILAQWGHAQS